MKEFRIVPLRQGEWVVQKRYKLFFGLVKTWSIAFPPDVIFSSMAAAEKYIRKLYPNEKLKITKGFSDKKK